MRTITSFLKQSLGILEKHDTFIMIKTYSTFTMSDFKWPLAIGIFKFAPSGLGPSLWTSNETEYLKIPSELDAKISSEKSDPL